MPVPPNPEAEQTLQQIIAIEQDRRGVAETTVYTAPKRRPMIRTLLHFGHDILI